MNSYLSRDEKENIVRLMTLRFQLEKVIELYSCLKNVDKNFLSELRHARTRLENSADIRLAYLDEQAKENLMASIAKLRIMFMATPEAIQANKDMLQLKSTLPINVEDFQDWFEFVIEHSCKNAPRRTIQNVQHAESCQNMMLFQLIPKRKRNVNIVMLLVNLWCLIQLHQDLSKNLSLQI